MPLFSRSRHQPEGVSDVAPEPTVASPPGQNVFHVQTAPSSLPDYVAVKERVQQQLITTVSPGSDLMTPGKARQVIEPMFNEALAAENLILNRNERAYLFQMILAEILGFGPIQPLLEDETLTEVMVNGAKQVYVERQGKLLLTDVVFEDDDHVLRIIERIVSPLGRRIDESSPMVNARLPDGSRVNAIIAPLSLVGPVLTIRKFSKIPFTVEDLIGFGTFTRESVQFIEAAVKARLNIVVSGGTGSGKTTLLNIVSRFIPHDERIVTIEDAAELQLRQDHVVRLETRPPNIEGKGRVTIRDLVVNALRMRPDRIVVGECRSGEALDMLQAMNTGHDGSVTTVHSNSPRDTLARMETMVLMAGMDLPLRAIRQQIASALDLIIHIERLRDGSRRVVKISEVIGMEGETILMQDIFVFAEEGTEGDKIKGRLQATGLRPRVMEKIEAAHVPLPLDIFYVYAPRGR